MRLRLRADVPVGCYLSGGLDSSLMTALAVEQTDHELRTFSLAFHDPRYDERPSSDRWREELGTRHHVVEIGPREIADAFPDVMRAPRDAADPHRAACRCTCSRSATREQGITVVATGEGADELFWGYDLFKEAKVRELLRARPGCGLARVAVRPLYPYFASHGRPPRRGLAAVLPRCRPGRRSALLAPDAHRGDLRGQGALPGETRAALAGIDPLERLRDELPAGSAAWSVLERAAYLELTTLLGNHLLAAQGDRVAMAHGVEGRFPFLDHRVFDYSVTRARRTSSPGLREKVALRALAAEVLPPIVAERPKQPYRAPEVARVLRRRARGG